MPLIDKSIIRRVERELYSYPQHLQTNAERREELLYGTPTMEGERTCPTNKTGNPTMMRGVGLAELSEGWAGVIATALKRMPWERKRVVEEFYFNGLKRWEVAQRLHVGETVVQLWKEDAREFVLLLATQRGLIKPIQE